VPVVIRAFGSLRSAGLTSREAAPVVLVLQSCESKSLERLETWELPPGSEDCVDGRTVSVTSVRFFRAVIKRAK
jgi:hypothetical protein